MTETAKKCCRPVSPLAEAHTQPVPDSVWSTRKPPESDVVRKYKTSNVGRCYASTVTFFNSGETGTQEVFAERCSFHVVGLLISCDVRIRGLWQPARVTPRTRRANVTRDALVVRPPTGAAKNQTRIVRFVRSVTIIPEVSPHSHVEQQCSPCYGCGMVGGAGRWCSAFGNKCGGSRPRCCGPKHGNSSWNHKAVVQGSARRRAQPRSGMQAYERRQV